jgi:ubiquinone/menaquinone biosynthesis C-methylase UbiE
MRFHPQAGRILDIGCGRGIMLSQLKQRGWQATGTEISEELAAASQKSGITVHVQADLRDCRFEANSFDVITLWHTLEHIANPAETLAEIHRILKPNGVVLIEVPNFDSWQSIIARGQWFHLDVPRHYWHFSKAYLQQELRKHNLEEIHTRTFSLEYGFYGCLQSLLNLFTLKPNFLYSLLRRRYSVITAQPLFAVWNIAITLLLIPFILPLSVILEGLAVIFFHRGSVARVVARKT